MALLRQSEAQRIASEAIALDLGDLSRQGEALLARARAQAALVIEQANAERQRIMQGAREQARAEGLDAGRREGFEAGRAQGHQAALAESRAKLEQLQQAWLAALGEFEARRGAMLQDAREDVLTLAVELTRRVVKRHVQIDPTVVQDQLAAVLGAIATATGVRVCVSPVDEALAREALSALSGRLASAQHAQLVVDAGLTSGSVVVRTLGGGGVDASIDTQLQRIAEALLPQQAEGARR